MGILDWFKSRPSQLDHHREADPDSELRKIVDKAISLTNPRLKLLPLAEESLLPAVKTTVAYLREANSELPGAIEVSAAQWASLPELKAFFVSASDVPVVLARSTNLRTLFDKYPGLGEVYFILGMAFAEQQANAISLQDAGGVLDSTKTVVSFSDHRVRICGQSEAEVRHILGTQVFEYLVAQAMSEIAEERTERRELEDNRSLIRARLRLLRQQGPGLGSVLGSPPSSVGEQSKLEAALLENERQLEELGSPKDVLETELEMLRGVLEHPEKYFQVERRQFLVDSMNIVLDEKTAGLGGGASRIAFSEARLMGVPVLQRAFIVGRVARSDVPVTKMNFENAVRYL
ncbi:hypothetical protein [Propionivibrio limicola]|uniref:hypothetical protein n=1 Tax=Propionivibrio limicola TaxID=167645 RepID=UPI001290C4C7|nr:hypothetical protein [Propionivibrio limicola]